MEHHFNVELATAYGIEKAVIINNLYFWIDHNAKNKVHIHDGYVWTYNSSSAFAKLFPYIKERTLARYLIELEENNIIISGNYNTNSFDKTKWYAFSIPFTYELQNLGYKIEDICSCQNVSFDSHKMANRMTESDEPIPYSKHTDGEKEKGKEDKSSFPKERLDYDEILSKWKEICPNLSQPRMLDDKRKKAIRELLKNNNATIEDLYKAFQMISISSYCHAKHQRNETWKATLNWLINDTKGCFNRLLEGEFAYTPSEREMAEKIKKGEWEMTDSLKVAYRPSGNNNIMWNSLYNCWVSIDYFNGSVIDGYNDENRPDGAEIVLHNARGTITWSKKDKKWNIEMKSPW